MTSIVMRTKLTYHSYTQVNTPSNKDMLVTALHCAALKNKTHAINLLLEFGANIDVQVQSNNNYNYGLVYVMPSITHFAQVVKYYYVVLCISQDV